jgi:hypothetical protein
VPTRATGLALAPPTGRFPPGTTLNAKTATGPMRPISCPAASTTGAALDQGCAPCAYEVCQKFPLCCAALWDANCELQAQDTCGCSCGVNTGGAPSGGTSSGAVPSGGKATGGRTTGGSATGGSGNSQCASVGFLPPMGTACYNVGESQCDSRISDPTAQNIRPHSRIGSHKADSVKSCAVIPG